MALAAIVVRRLALAVPTLLGITLLAFLLIHLAPGEPISAEQVGSRAALSAEALAKMREVYHLDEPVWRQFLLWLGGLARGDLGVSLYDGEPVGRKIAARLPATVLLAFVSTLLAWAVALPLGIASATRPGSSLDRGSGLLFYSLYSVPVFWAAILLQVTFAVALRWLPLQGMESDAAAGMTTGAWLADRLRHLVLPAVCLAYGQIAFLARYARAGMLEARGEDYIRTARAKGLPETTITFRHALANALLPLITIVGFTLPALAGGSVIVERIFSWPGAGRLLFDSIHRRDLTTLMGLTLVGAVLTLLGTLLADILYAIADPRVRLARREPR